mmetsp:Transcript_38252/g.101151  ORF Transcript_38252/g.101151 Transcript_38252/m.101151 type:complete len:334 (+) Transcript_38252:482-1483(+)
MGSRLSPSSAAPPTWRCGSLLLALGSLETSALACKLVLAHSLAASSGVVSGPTLANRLSNAAAAAAARVSWSKCSDKDGPTPQRGPLWLLLPPLLAAPPAELLLSRHSAFSRCSGCGSCCCCAADGSKARAGLCNTQWPSPLRRSEVGQPCLPLAAATAPPPHPLAAGLACLTASALAWASVAGNASGGGRRAVDEAKEASASGGGGGGAAAAAGAAATTGGLLAAAASASATAAAAAAKAAESCWAALVGTSAPRRVQAVAGPRAEFRRAAARSLRPPPPRCRLLVKAPAASAMGAMELSSSNWTPATGPAARGPTKGLGPAGRGGAGREAS